MQETEKKPRSVLLGLLMISVVIAGAILLAMGLVQGLGYLIGF